MSDIIKISKTDLSNISKINKLEFNNLYGFFIKNGLNKFIIKFSKDSNLPISLLVELFQSQKKLKLKLPTLFQKGFLVTTRALEQASSEITAKYKQSIIKGDKFIDLTGGLGIDTIFISKNFLNSTYCETQESLINLFTYNLNKINITNINIINNNGIEYLKKISNNYFDWIYIDPSRRDNNRRYKALSQCEPNITDKIDLILSKTDKICIKASPAYDISMAINEIKNIYEIIVISIGNECKELLLLVSKNETIKSNILIKSVIFNKSEKLTYENKTLFNQKYKIASTTDISGYFYEPDSAIIKANQVAYIAEKYKISFIKFPTVYLTSKYLITNFPGKTFKVIQVIPWKRKTVSQYLKESGIFKANVARRDFPINPDGIKKILKIEDGGKIDLFFTRNSKNKKIVIHCQKV